MLVHIKDSSCDIFESTSKILYKKFEACPISVEYLMRNWNIDYILSVILASKGIKEVDKFLKPQLKNHFPSEDFFLDMEKALLRIAKAINQKEKICIFGDYDVDGNCSASLLYKFLITFSANLEVYIPHRIKEGYGPNKEAIDKISAKGCAVLVMLDCGSNAIEIVQYANQFLEVIIIDHHVTPIVPKAHSVINPNRLDQKEGYEYLCATGMTFIFCVFLNKALKNKECLNFNYEARKVLLADMLDMVSLATICDVMPLINLNRSLVKRGLDVLKDTQNLGLSTLMDLIKIKSINTFTLGFQIGPRINAGGRLSDPDLGFKLLTSTDKRKADLIAGELEIHNEERKKIEEEILSKVSSENFESECIFVGDTWHLGVIGIISARLKDKFHKVSVVYSIKDNICKASARSIENVDLSSIIANAKLNNLIIDGGGHKMAGGFSFHIEKIDKLKIFFDSEVSLQLKGAPLLIKQYIDIPHNAINFSLLESLNKLEPFGRGNEEPIFRIDRVRCFNIKHIKDKFYTAMVELSDKRHVKASLFDLNNLHSIDFTKNLSIIVNIRPDYFGKSGVQINIKDVIL